MSNVVVSFDPAWGGTGWAICTERAPIYAGHFKPGKWRMRDLRVFLRELEPKITDALTELGPHDPPPRVVYEQIPWNYHLPKGSSRKDIEDRIAAQSRVGWGVGQITGALEMWGCRRIWGYPWKVPVTTWRGWWGRMGRGKEAKKRAAINLVSMQWGAFLRPHRDINAKGDGPRGDVAEAILIGVGAARNIHLAPAGPREFRACQAAS